MVKAKTMMKTCNFGGSCNTSMVYLFGFIGALVYHIQNATSVTGGIIGVLKSVIWPAYLVHGLLKLIGA